jgi:hypothetical protein
MLLDSTHPRDSAASDVSAAPAIPGFTSETASIGGIRIHYWVGGDPNGQPVLLWHGFLSTGYTWRKVMPVLADAGLAVLVPESAWLRRLVLLAIAQSEALTARGSPHAPVQ